MQRRKFLQQVAWLTGGILIAGQLPASVLTGSKKKIRGRVLVKGRGIRDVVVSDGYNVVVTGSNGKFEFEPHPDATAVFVSTPSGHAFNHENGVAKHYYLLKEASGKKNLDFELEKLEQDDNDHQFVIWADPQVKNKRDVERMMNESVPDVQKFVAAAGAGTLLHGITVGDIVWDELKLFAEYNRAVGKMGIPFFQCLGNHDMDYNKGGDDASDDTFQQTYGPTYYSFNRGQAHYVVMDNVRYLGKDREYDGFITQNQLDWLQKDLEQVAKDKLVILCVHIPVANTKNKQDLYALLTDRNVHIMSGHTHYHRNIITNNIFEHNHGTVCGAWWTGDICEDGTPNGYGVYRVKGNELQWHYRSTGKTDDHQMNAYLSDADDSNKLLQVNIWNHDPKWKTEYFIDGVSKGSLEQFEGLDPVAFAKLLGPELPKPRGFAEPKKTSHLFKAKIPASAKEIRIVATDRFGKIFSHTQAVGQA